MSKNMKTLVAATAILGLLSLSAFQQSSLTEYERTILSQRNEIQDQSKTISDLDLEIQDLNTTNSLLLIELDLVRDSLNIMKNDLWVLKKEVTKSKNNLKAVEKELTIRKKELKFIKSQIKKLKKSKKQTKTIAHLKNKVNALENQVTQLSGMQETEVANVVQVETQSLEQEEAILEKEALATKMANLKVVLDKTIIDYRGIALRTERDSDNINKLKKKGRNWKYTVVNFDLQNAVPTLLLDAEFEWKIIDMDTGKPLSYIESNKVYPDGADQKGLTFTYPGHAQEIVFINTDEKEGTNYELRLYYIQDGQSYYINTSSRPIVFDKQAID